MRLSSNDNEISDSDSDGGTGPIYPPNSRLNVEVHPLQRPYIMERVFRSLTTEELKNARLSGSRMWYGESIKSWRLKAVLIISQKSEPEAGQGISVHALQELYNDERDSLRLHSKPFHNYKLSHFDEIDEHHQQLRWFLQTFSNVTKYLCLENCSFLNIETLMNLIFVELPHLQTLKLKGEIHFLHGLNHPINFDLYEVHSNLTCLEIAFTSKLNDPLPFPWHEFMKKMLNLNDLRIKLDYKDTQAEVWAIMSSVNVARNANREKLNLTNLEIYPVSVEGEVYCHQGEFVDIINLIPNHLVVPYPLERFTGSVYHIGHMTQYFKTLLFLRLRFLDPVHCCMSTFVGGGRNRSGVTFQLPNLKEFECIGRLAIIFKNLGKCVAPNLFRLKIEPPDNLLGEVEESLLREEDNISTSMSSIVFGNLREFECNHVDYIFEKEEISQLAHSMPNLTRLVMPLTANAFQEVCRVWPKLRSIIILESDRINIEGKVVDDQAITGISTSDSSSCKRKPNITDLIELMDFAIHCDRGVSRLTEFSVKNGFLCLPSLETLKVTFCKISKSSKVALQKKLRCSEIIVKKTETDNELLRCGIPDQTRRKKD